MVPTVTDKMYGSKLL